MLKYILPVVLLCLVGCDDDESGGQIEITAGIYHSQCDVSAADSKHYILTVEANYDRTIEEITFTGVTDCSNTGVTVLIDVGSFVLSGVDLGGGVSYLTDSAAGGDATPYYFDGTSLYTDDTADITSGAATVFAAFIANHVSESELIYVFQP